MSAVPRALPDENELRGENCRLLAEIAMRLKVEEELRVEIEERKHALALLEEAHAQLLQSEKMAAIGQLAAGVAHEINNPIGYVSSNLVSLVSYIDDMFALISKYDLVEQQLSHEVRSSIIELKKDLDLEFIKTDVPELLKESKEGIERVQTIVHSLKDFSRLDVDREWQWSNVHKGLESTLNLVWSDIRRKATVHKEYDDKLPEIECVPSQLNQVFMNLLLNAAQSMEKTGDIWIRTGSNSNEIWIEIADTGKGIAAENLQRIFDPFFTTKAIGDGAGLGLSLSYGIIQKHHGRIEVKSDLMQGSTFRIWLPVKHSTDSIQLSAASSRAIAKHSGAARHALQTRS